MTRYELTFMLPYKLDAYDHVTLKERLERELQSYLDDRDIKAVLTGKTESYGTERKDVADWQDKDRTYR